MASRLGSCVTCDMVAQRVEDTSLAIAPGGPGTGLALDTGLQAGSVERRSSPELDHPRTGRHP